LADCGLTNYWGYNSIGFFAPDPRFLPNGAIAEVKSAVKRLHEVGIEVILDVVYNHTGEGDQRGPIYSYKGIDNSTYYLISNRPDEPYENFAGTGNTLNCANRAVRKMIMDSVRHWADQMHVDGFRFDLASIFTRNADGSVDSGFIASGPMTLEDLPSGRGPVMRTEVDRKRP